MWGAMFDHFIVVPFKNSARTWNKRPAHEIEDVNGWICGLGVVLDRDRLNSPFLLAVRCRQLRGPPKVSVSESGPVV